MKHGNPDPKSKTLPKDLFLIGCGLAGQIASRSARTKATPDKMGFKAYNLMRMAEIKLPVPPAFVLGTAYCGSERIPTDHWLPGLKALEQRTGQVLGDSRRPLLLSVRSGAPVSMPGMMETLLNIGLCDVTAPGLLRQTGNPRLVWDAYRRLVATYGEVVAGLSNSVFEQENRALFGHRNLRDLDFAELRELTRRYLAVYLEAAGTPFPQDARTQLIESIDAVQKSWKSSKAVEYRHLNQIGDDIGTAVTVQTMVFGNAGGKSGAGVGFTRDPVSGAPGLWVDFLFNAQGEDVVSGRHNVHGHFELSNFAPEVWDELCSASKLLERNFGDMQDFEFTLQDGRIFMLQTRTGKRTPLAAARIALDLCDEGLISPELARQRTDGLIPEALAVEHLISDNGDQTLKPLTSAVTASSGVAVGEIAFDEDRAREQHANGKPVVLVRRDAETSDISALSLTLGILTERGARTSHAAVVARQMGKVCLVGCSDMHLDAANRKLSIGKQDFREGDLITLDGNTGAIYAGAVQTTLCVSDELVSRLNSLRGADK